MTTLKLYKGVNFDGVNSFPDIPTKTAFDNYLAAKQQYSQTVQYNRIGEPILIQKGYDVAISYSYGCINTGTKKYFIIPDSINVNENGRVFLAYSVDWYTTLKYDSKISFGRSHLIKSTSVDPLTYPQSLQPIDMLISSHIPLDDTGYGEIYVAYTTADESSEVKWVLCIVENGQSIVREVMVVVPPDNNVITTSGFTIGADEIMNGLLYQACGIAPSNILSIYYVPFSTADTNFNGPYKANYKDVGDRRYVWYELDEMFANPVSLKKYKDCDLTSSAMYSVHLIDRYGSIIYSVPYGRTLKRVIYKPVFTPASCYVAIEFFYGTAPPTVLNPLARKSAENSYMLYMCEKIDYNNDAYANWASGLKGVEMEERRIQKNKNLVAGIGGSAITGAIGGASGNPIAAAVGVVGGIAGAAFSYATDTYYESKINTLEDRKYQLAQDTMVPGGFLGIGSSSLDIVVLSASVSDIARYDAELSNFGVDCNLPVSSWVPAVGAFKFTDVEVIADVPYSIKQNIKQKLLNGIKIVDVT